MEEFENFNVKTKEQFDTFFQQRCYGQSLCETFCSLAWEIYQLQICMEGILDDLDLMSVDNEMKNFIG